MTEVDLDGLLAYVDDDVATELSCKPEVIDKGHDLDQRTNALAIEMKKYVRLRAVEARRNRMARLAGLS